MNVAAYARYSTDNQTENSIAFQMNAIEEYCQKNNHTVALRFQDEAMSGTNTNRQNFQLLCAAARNHMFEAVVIYDITRGSRDVADWFNFRKEMLMAGVQVISVSEKLGDILDPNDFLVELLGIGIGQHHVLTTRKKIIAGITTRAKDGVFLGGIPPLGYDIVDQRYVINPREAEMVRKIFTMYAAGRSYMDILTALGGAIGKRGRPLGKTSLKSILENDRYTGTYTWNRRQVKTLGKWAGGGPNENIVRIENAIPPIISEELFMKAQQRMRNKRNNARSNAKHNYLLTGILRCGECGAYYVGQMARNQRGVENFYYICGNKKNNKTCSAPMINCDKLDPVVLDIVMDHMSKFDDVVARKILDEYKQASGDCTAERKELLSVQTKIQNGINAILAGNVFPELMEQIEGLKKRKAELENTIANSNSDALDLSKIKQMFLERLHLMEDPKALIRTCVSEIQVHPEKRIAISLGVLYTDSSGEGI